LCAWSAACSAFLIVLTIRLHTIVLLSLRLSMDHGGEYGAGGEQSYDADGWDAGAIWK